MDLMKPPNVKFHPDETNCFGYSGNKLVTHKAFFILHM
jgi:hypothetical protein